ncbi:MAG: hypothetical protein PHW13_01595 [Methylococcales bacterium]|nr:hypothetical protein [Methylococcales bacterium]
MSRFRLFIMLFYIIWLAGIPRPGLTQEAIAIITQRDNTINSINLETLKLVYLRKLMLDSSGNRWIPLNLPSSSDLRQEVSGILFKKRPEDMEDYWNEQYFQGISPPKVLASEEAMLRFVTITPGAIGYVHKHLVDNRVKVLKIISTAEDN